jgi:cell division protein FtsW
VGAVGLVFALLVPIEWWYRLSTLLAVAAFALLAGVLVPGIGYSVNGAVRWLELGPVSLQASEPARLFLLIYVAGYAVRRHESLATTFAGLLRPMALLAAASVLLLMEPDLSATVVLVAAALGLLFAAGARLRDCIVGVGCASVAIVVLAISEPYRLQRFLGFLNPWADAQNTGYQVVNSLIAIGSGGWFGAGLGDGVQKLYYLPEPHTDFVFAVLAEELGLVGATLALALLALLVYRAFVIGQHALRRGFRFHGLLAIGIALLLGLQVVINVGVNTSLLPPTGLTLPLISYGRTSVVVCLFALGLLLRIARELGAGEPDAPRANTGQPGTGRESS